MSRHTLTVLFLAALVTIPLVFFLFQRSEPDTKLAPPPVFDPTNAPVPDLPPPRPETNRVAFSTFGTNKTFLGGSGWSVGLNAHAESFVSETSGRLSSIEMALEPNYVRKGREKPAADATVFIAADANGFPGTPLEEFSIVADPPNAPAPTNALKYASTGRPLLEAGKKYWLGARCPGPGSWVWRFNDQNLARLSAYEKEPGQWASAGNGRNGAFSISVTPGP